MEKLQTALQQARRDRNRGAAAPAVENHTAESPPARQEADSLWEALPPLELNSKLLAKNRVVSMAPSAQAMPFDILRTKMLIQMRQNNWRRVAITSPLPESGKSTTAANLAAALTRQSDTRGIVYDFDLRRPRLAKLFGHTPTRTATELLRGDVSFADQAVRLGTNIALCLERSAVHDPAALLMHERVKNILDEVEATYEPDIVLFDLPPVLVGDETRAFLGHVDCCLIVVEAERTRVAQIDITEREIAEHTNVLGIVLNRCRFTADPMGDSYYNYTS